MGRGKRNRERTEFWTWVRTASSSATFHEELPTALIGVDRTLKNLARKTCRPRDTCFRVNRGSEGERDRANLSCFWHFLSSMNHAAEKIFCPPGKGQNQQQPRPTSSAAPQWVRSTRAVVAVGAVAKTTFQQFLLHPNHPLQSPSPSQTTNGGGNGSGSSNSQWVSQMIHPSLLPRPSATARCPRPAPSIHSSSPVQQPQQHFFQTPSSGVVIVVSLSPSPLSPLRSSLPTIVSHISHPQKGHNNYFPPSQRESFPTIVKRYRCVLAGRRVV